MRCPNGHQSEATDYCDTCGAAMGATSTLSALPPTDADESPPAAPQTPDAAAVPATSPDADGADVAGDPLCPNCGAPNSPDALFCEACGYDYTTGSMPRGANPSGGAGENGSAATGAGSPAAVGSAPPVATTSASATPANASRSLTDPWVAEVWVDPAWYRNQGSPDPLPSPGPPDVVALRNTSLLIGRESVSRGIHPDIDCGTDNGVSRRHAQLTTDGSRWWVEDLESANGTYLGETVGDLPTTSLPPHKKREISSDDRLYVGSWTRIVIRPSSEDEVDALA